jgi:hypothetical protein
MPEEAKPVYQSFLVRCWLVPSETSDEPPAWRFEVQDVSAESQKYRFGNLGQLSAFVAARLTAVATVSNQVDDEVSSI